MFEKYYTPAQQQKLRARAAAVGPQRIEQVQQEWRELIAAVRDEIARGTAPSDPTMQALSHKWQSLIDEFTGGDPEIEQGLRQLYRAEPDAAARHGYDLGGNLMDYVGSSIDDSRRSDQ